MDDLVVAFFLGNAGTEDATGFLMGHRGEIPSIFGKVLDAGHPEWCLKTVLRCLYPIPLESVVSYAIRRARAVIDPAGIDVLLYNMKEALMNAEVIAGGKTFGNAAVALWQSAQYLWTAENKRRQAAAYAVLTASYAARVLNMAGSGDSLPSAQRAATAALEIVKDSDNPILRQWFEDRSHAVLQALESAVAATDAAIQADTRGARVAWISVAQDLQAMLDS